MHSMDVNYFGHLTPSDTNVQGMNVQGAQTKQVSYMGNESFNGECDSDELETAAKSLLLQLAMTTKRIMLVKTCISTLQAAIHHWMNDPSWKVAPFGSASSGFCTCYSDLDATCYREGSDDANIAGSTQALQQMLQMLQQHPRFEVIEQIWSARIPILRLKFHGDKRCRGTLEVDLSCNNTEPLPNTHLLRAYSKLNPMVPALVLVIKHWAKTEKISGAAEKNLSSYSITLMVIYFLLATPSLNLSFPHIPTQLFGPPGTKPKAPRLENEKKWSPTQPLSMLIRGFFYFFSQEFVWGDEVVSVRNGKRLSASNGVYSNLRGRFDTSRIHIEDPYLVARNLNCTLSQQQEFLLRRKFCWAWQQLQQNCIPPSLSAGVQSGKDEKADQGVITAHEKSEQLSNKADSQKEKMTHVGDVNSTPLALQSIYDTSELQQDCMRIEESQSILSSPPIASTTKAEYNDCKSHLQTDEMKSGLVRKRTWGKRKQEIPEQTPSGKSFTAVAPGKVEQIEDKAHHLPRDTVQVKHIALATVLPAGQDLTPEVGADLSSLAPNPKELPFPITLFTGSQDIITL